ncbi:carbohydrate sulfotransferase 9-like [Ylistrum balloti]|uniref:carbohydrate sulfotransferase 9-like n=1 Tax=Ylistrum balloti TaxID=509963 RepID=UPI0029058A26|nr:carbohydrate sulfotransferase 9-like [Ylistrum balloti]
MEKIFAERTQHLRKGCEKTEERNKYIIKNRQSQTELLYFKKYHFSICEVPKAGSTLWAILFLMLETPLSAERILNTPRHEIHYKVKGERVQSNNELLKSSRIVVSRDPYARLYSAFVDKIFLLRNVEYSNNLANSLQKGLSMTKAGPCGFDISFHEFVDKETKNGLRGGHIDRHWGPIYTMCKACDIGYQYIIQQETLTRDTEYIIGKLKTTTEIKATLWKLFHGSDSKKPIEVVLKTMWSDFDTPLMKKSCSNKLAFAMNLWDGFKLQGYIRTDAEFPLSFQESSNVNVDGFTKAILDEMYTNPLSSVERKDQRRRALVKAYADMPRRIIAQIQQMYKMDFDLFNYDIDPPT